MAKASKVIVKRETAFSDRPADMNKTSEGVTASAAKPTTVAATNAAVEPSGPAVVEHVPDAPSSEATGTNSEATKPVIADQHVAVNASPAADVTFEVTPAAPSLGAATGTISSIPPESVDQGGAGNMAGSAGAPTLTELEAEVDADIQARVDATEAEFRAKYPRTFAALDAWRAAEGDEGEQPTGLRIKSKIEGFRRAGIAHSKATVDHPLETFAGRHEGERVGLARLEMLFAEPNLVVELI